MTPKNDLVLAKPLSLDLLTADHATISAAIDPEATQYKGLYFHYMASPQVSHSSYGTVSNGFDPAPDREWMIRAFVTAAK